MSGHSKWENIKRQKSVEDKKRSKIFGKLSKLITTAVAEGGSDDPSTNAQLRQVIDRAKDQDMPKENIQRAIDNATKSLESAEEMFLEAYGPSGVAVLIRGRTDNRQRTIQEIKALVDRHDGSLAEPGAVAYQFKKIGKIILKNVSEEKLLSLLDLSGILGFETKNGKTVLTVESDKLSNLVKQIDKMKLEVLDSFLFWEAANKLIVKDKEKVSKLEKLFNVLEERVDVIGVFHNLENNG